MKLPRRISGTPSPLMVAMREAIKAGLEVWQVSTSHFSCMRLALPVNSHAHNSCIRSSFIWQQLERRPGPEPRPDV